MYFLCSENEGADYSEADLCFYFFICNSRYFSWPSSIIDKLINEFMTLRQFECTQIWYKQGKN